MGLSYSEDLMIVGSLSRFDTVPACDGQTERRTDGRTDGFTIASTVLSILC